jgi:hypothetical protein
MRKWLRRIRGALGLGLTWAVGWFLVGMGIEIIHNIWPNPLGSAVDIWPAALAYPAFLGGLVFSTVLGIAGRRRRFDESSLPRFAAWGALGGLTLGLFPAAFLALGGVSVAEAAATIGTLILLGAASASGSLILARRAEDRELLEASAEVAEVGLADGETQELLGGGG